VTAKFISICVSVGLVCAGAAADAASPSTAVPDFSSNGTSWAGFVAPRTPSAAVARTFNDFSQPASGPGPVTEDPAHPYVNNELARETNQQPTYRVANLNNPNLKPWVVEALRQQNELALAGRRGETREARCWETGVPAYHLNPGAMYFIQTPKEVVLYLAGRTRHIYLNVPHSSNPKPSWYGESVGHYEGGTLVIDTISITPKVAVDYYNTPHTDKLHVVERYRLADDGRTLEVTFTVDDEGAFTMPWSASQRYQKAAQTPMEEVVCAEGEAFAPIQDPQQALFPIPRAAASDF